MMQFVEGLVLGFVVSLGLMVLIGWLSEEEVLQEPVVTDGRNVMAAIYWD